MTRSSCCRFIVVSILAATVAPAWAVPDGPIADAAPLQQASPEGALKARLDYNVGYEAYEVAARAEMANASLTGASARAAADQVRARYVEARDRFQSAVEADPSQKQGWNMLGFTRRKLGEYEAALVAYERALALDGAYHEAIEYRAEALLGLNRIEEAKAAHQQLLAASPSYAAVLRESMQAWVKARRAQPNGVAPADIDALEAWLKTAGG